MFFCSWNAQVTFVENTELKIISFQSYKHWYLIQTWSDTAFRVLLWIRHCHPCIEVYLCIWYCLKENGFTSNLKNHILSEMGLFILHNCCVSRLLDYLTSLLEHKSRLPTLEFSVRKIKCIKLGANLCTVIQYILWSYRMSHFHFNRKYIFKNIDISIIFVQTQRLIVLLWIRRCHLCTKGNLKS